MKPLAEMGKFKTVVIDPPWDAGGYFDRQRGAGRNGSPVHAEHDYDTMSLDEIGALPIRKVCDDDAWIFLWTTSGMLPGAFGVLVNWQIPYKCTMVWHKPNGPKPTGYPTYNGEYILVGKVGKARFLDSKGLWLANCWDAPHNPDVAAGGWGRQVDNSSKPEGFYDLLRRVTPAPRLDIFGRRRIAGFHSWGNEAPEGEPEPDHYQTVMV